MSTWTPERIIEVTRLWDEGLTTAEIGKVLGVSKNAVVGKAHRLGLPARPSPIRRSKSEGATKAKPVAKPPLQPRISASIINTSGACCKWPFGHPGEEDFHFCESPSLVGKSYCPKHYEMAYLPARGRGEGKFQSVSQGRSTGVASGRASAA